MADKLKVIPWDERTGLTMERKVRTIKMIAPVCATCPKRPGWIKDCKHDPYHSVQIIEDREPVTETDADGNELVVDWKVKTRRVRAPNTRQIGAHVRIGSGEEVARKQRRGWKLPPDLGYAPMCQFRDCWASNPTVKTEAGDYCSTPHAKAGLLKHRGIIEEVYDQERRAKQFSEISLS
jgi:hypothetical protein